LQLTVVLWLAWFIISFAKDQGKVPGVSIQLNSMNAGFALTDGKARRRSGAFALHRVLAGTGVPFLTWLRVIDEDDTLTVIGLEVVVIHGDGAAILGMPYV
jgi:hypothetical protein